MIPADHAIILSLVLFSIGLIGLLIRRNLLMILLSIEIMLNAANLLLVTGSYIHGNLEGQIIAFFVMVIAAAEVTIGLAIAILFFRLKKSVDTEKLDLLKG